MVSVSLNVIKELYCNLPLFINVVSKVFVVLFTKETIKKTLHE